MSRAAVLGVVAAGGGFAVGRATAPRASEVVEVLREVRAVEDAAGGLQPVAAARLPPPPVGDPDEVVRLREALAAAEQACAVQFAAAGCTMPLAWPEDVPAGLSREAMARLVDEVAARCPEVGAKLLELDCGEFPCAFYYRAGQEALRECGLAPRGVPGFQVSSVGMSRNGVPLTALTFWPPDLPPDVERAVTDRWNVRYRQAAEMFADELEAAAAE